jgi:hypothetical protein
VKDVGRLGTRRAGEVNGVHGLQQASPRPAAAPRDCA